MRALGIDFGERRIGLAISDSEGSFALPFGTLERTSDRSAIDRIARIAASEGVGRLVVGEPVGLDGARGPGALRARRFAERLGAATGLPHEMVGEALTTVAAIERLRAAGVDTRKERHRIDAVAAQILLEEALSRGRANG
ncbi:MAG TPA: Holliday junction resolvase RuvX [Thermoanaerobaculia bacterium]|nr:Holliday junction resolvase RuvX [Thermoanaerobaculia bacterium]